MKITADFTQTLEKIKPIHGVGQPPFEGTDFSMVRHLKAAAVPYSRLHDVGGAFGGNLFVDIPNIFRDFSADETDPASYDFAFTDLLLSALVSNGVEPFFRLGVTIENHRSVRAYRIDPPTDYGKWARICEHIVRHYTCGWANGFFYTVNYWEIWNEPDNYETPEENQMWTGSALDYYRLYEVASKHLKACFPHLKIGGYASCGFYAITGADNVRGASSPRTEYFIDFFDGFMDYVAKNNCPLDFFSWHSYAEIQDNVRWAAYVRDRLDSAGFASAEHTLNEWNCHPELKGTFRHGALTAGMLLALQKTSLDSTMFYDAGYGLSIYRSLFEPVTKKLYPAYYSIFAFGKLYTLGTRAKTSPDAAGVYSLAAVNGEGKAALVIANTNDSPVELELELIGADPPEKVMQVSEGCLWQEASLPKVLEANSFICLEAQMKN
ncbi:MAG: hypothetical protein IJY86_06820 [Clostridia bacterium]|nr:hypothetical protein [Clostridia bacterium]